MSKDATLNLRIDSELKSNAEDVLGKLGVPMSTAIDMYLNQIVLKGGIPFPITVDSMKGIDATSMSEKKIQAKLQEGYEDYLDGNVSDAMEIFKEIKN